MNLLSRKKKLSRKFSNEHHDDLIHDFPAPLRERRRWRRVEIETLVAAIKNDGSRFEGYCRDISNCGTAAIVWGDLVVGDEVHLAYRPLGSLEETVIPAIVRSATANRYGFEFAVTDAAELHELVVRACRTAEVVTSTASYLSLAMPPRAVLPIS